MRPQIDRRIPTCEIDRPPWGPTTVVNGVAVRPIADDSAKGCISKDLAVLELVLALRSKLNHKLGKQYDGVNSTSLRLQQCQVDMSTGVGNQDSSSCRDDDEDRKMTAT